MKILILLLLTSCASGYHSYTDNSWHPDIEDQGKIITCPKDYIYNARTELCHYFKVYNEKPTNDKPRAVKRVKKESESSKCVKAIHKAMQCGVSI